MRVLVLGATGQVGVELLHSAAALPLQVITPAACDFTMADELERAMSDAAPELIVNAAAYTQVDRAEQERERAFAVNAEAPRRMAEWCAKHRAKLLHISTDYVFDGTKTGHYEENDATAPTNVYGQTKLEGERAVRDALSEHVILRTSWVFSAQRQNFVKTMLKLGQQRSTLRVVADQRGRPTAARDIAATIWSLAQQLQQGGSLPWGTYHFAGAGATTWYAFAKSIFEEAATLGMKGPEVTPIATSEYPTPAARPANSVLDTSRFEGTFGAPRPWRAGLQEVVRALGQAGWNFS